MNYTDLFDLSEWKKSKDIAPILVEEHGCKNLVSADSAWRKSVRENNLKYINGNAEHYIIHGNEGFKWAKDREEIIKSVRNLEKRALSMLATVSKTRKALEVTGQGVLTNNLASLRVEADITGYYLVELVREKHPELHFDQPTLSRIETGAAMPTSAQMIALAEALNKEPYEVFGTQALLI